MDNIRENNRAIMASFQKKMQNFEAKWKLSFRKSNRVMVITALFAVGGEAPRNSINDILPHISSRSLTRALTRLKEQGLIEYVEDDTDARRQIVRLSLYCDQLIDSYFIETFDALRS